MDALGYAADTHGVADVGIIYTIIIMSFACCIMHSIHGRSAVPTFQLQTAQPLLQFEACRTPQPLVEDHSPAFNFVCALIVAVQVLRRLLAG